MTNLIHKSIAEGVGTFWLVFAGCGGLMIEDRFPGSLSSGVIPVLFGLSVCAMIYALGHISGAHLNPAVSIAFAVSRQFPMRELFGYCLGQSTGAILAIALLTAVLPSGDYFGATVPTAAALQALLWEITLTFFLMFVIVAVATDTRAEGTMAGAAIGATVIVCALVGGPISGASMNPARSLAPALFQGTLESLWIYLIGPCVGATLAALVYEWIRCDPNRKEAKGCC